MSDILERPYIPQISNSIEKTLNNLNAQDIDEILKRRYEKIMSYGLV